MNYIKRYWDILFILFVLVLGFMSEKIYEYAGTSVYLPMLFFGALAMALLARNVLNSDTTDRYVDDQNYEKDFHGLSPRDKVWHTSIQFWVYLIAAAIIASAVL